MCGLCGGAFGGSERLLTFGPNLYEILEYLELLHYGGLGTEVQVVAGVQHEHGGEADGQVVRVHLVPGGLGRDARQVVQQVNKAVLGSGALVSSSKVKLMVYLEVLTLLAFGRQSKMEKTSLALPSGSFGRKTPTASTSIW